MSFIRQDVLTAEEATLRTAIRIGPRRSLAELEGGTRSPTGRFHDGGPIASRSAVYEL